jgi:hypothetical protein
MQRYDAISILVTALVFLGLSTGIFALFKSSLRQATPYGVVRIRPGRPFFLLGVSCERVSHRLSPLSLYVQVGAIAAQHERS